MICNTYRLLLPAGRELALGAMAARELNITKLALRLGISRKHLSNLLNGHAPLGNELAYRLEEAVRLDEGELADLRHDGVVIAQPLSTVPRVPLRVLADPTEPIEDW
jgi:transcriptional regulator with XRE-family HTH domain